MHVVYIPIPVYTSHLLVVKYQANSELSDKWSLCMFCAGNENWYGLKYYLPILGAPVG